MLSSSVAGGSVCLGCQLRAVSRRAAPALAAAAQAKTLHTGRATRRRQHGSEAVADGGPEDELVAILKQQSHRADDVTTSSRRESKRTRPQDDWDTPQDDWDSQAPAQQSQKHVTDNSQPQQDLASILRQQIYEEPTRSKYTRRKAATTDDWDLPREQSSSNRRNAVEELFEDDWTATGEETSREILHSETFKDDESQAQEEFGYIRRVPSKEPVWNPKPSPFEEPEAYRPPVPRISEPRKYRKGRTKMVEDLSKLSVETLGKEAEVIVLREGGDWFTKPFKEDERPSDPGLSLDEYADQDVSIGMDTIMENIDGARPAHRILSSREFKEVFDMLSKGFTSLQLEAYVERHMRQLEEGDETPFTGVPSEASVRLPWVLEQSVWTPEVKDAVQEVEPVLKGYVLKSMRPKQRLVMQLMRECWGISAQELMDGQGVLEVRVRDLEFKLLILGTQRWLQLISRVYLSQGGGKSIEVVKSRKSIRIVAPKVVAEACLKAMDEKLQNKITRSFKLDEMPLKQLNTGLLEELGKVTNSVVALNKARNEVEVTWIDTRHGSGTNLESLADVVRRLLLTAFPSTRTGRALTVYPATEGRGKLIPYIGSSDKLSWIDRRLKWARLCLPLSAEPAPVSTSWPLDQASAMKYAIRPTEEDLNLPTSTIEPKKRAFYDSLEGEPLAIPKPPREPEQEPQEQRRTQTTPSGWLPFMTRTDAIFGHILHPRPDATTNSLQNGISALATYPRALIPLIPPINELNLTSWVPYSTPSYMTSIVLLRFIPYSSDPTRPVDPLAPHLELRIKATDEDIIGIDSLRAVAHTHVSDVLLPVEQVDVRVTQKVVAELPGEQVDAVEGLQPLLQFLQDAKLEMAKGRLYTPPRLHDLGLPRWMFYRPEADPASPFMHTPARRRLEQQATGTSSSTTGPNTVSPAPYDSDTNLPSYAEQHRDPIYNELRTGSYAFAGLELRRPLETTFDGWRLTYTSVEAGQGGGRRAELALEAVPGADRELRRGPDDIDAQRFIRSVYKLARGVEANLVVRPSDGSEVRPRVGWVGKAAKS